MMRFIVAAAWLLSIETLLAQSSGELLRKAALSGDLVRLDNLLNAGADANDLDKLGQTPLTSAVVGGQPLALQRLLQSHADPNAPMTQGNSQSETPLQYAAEQGNLRIASILISSGAQVNDGGRTARSPLHYAVGRLDVMRLLIEKGAAVDARDAEGASPLDDAVWRGSIDAAAILIAHGAKMNEPDTQTGATPINEAAYRGNTEMVRYLLQFHPDLDVPDKRGRMPLENTIRAKTESAAVLLLNAESANKLTAARFTQLMDAAIRSDEPSVVAALLDKGASRDATLPSGYTPLDAAAFSGAVKSAGVLLDGGADPNSVTKDGSTPLEDAAAQGANAVIVLLLDHGARIDRMNSLTRATPIYAAATAEKLSTVKLLLDRGANPSICGANRKTALQAALDNGFAEIARELTSRGAAAGCK